MKQMNRKVLTLIFFTLSTTAIFAQATKTTTDVQQIWVAYYNQARFTDKWGLWTDLHLRTKERFASKFSQSIFRFGLTYYLTDNAKLTAGYAYVPNYPGEGNAKVTRPEHRIWQQIQWHTKYGNQRMMQWIRLEERYRHKVLNDSTLASGYNFSYRLRYNILYEVPFTKQPTNKLSFVVNDEVHINFGKEILYNYFDQNRFFVGLKFNINKTDNVQFGYMNQFQQLAAGNKFRNNHVIRLFYFQNLDLRKKKQ